MRNWREERSVRLDQHLVRGKPFCRFLQVRRVLERDDSRQRDEEAEVEALAGKVGRSREAVEDAADAPFPDGGGQDFGRVFLRVAGMDDERQPGLPRGLDMRFEAIALRMAVRLVVIIIEPALADGDHTRL